MFRILSYNLMKIIDLYFSFFRTSFYSTKSPNLLLDDLLRLFISPQFLIVTLKSPTLRTLASDLVFEGHLDFSTPSVLSKPKLN